LNSGEDLDLVCEGKINSIRGKGGEVASGIIEKKKLEAKTQRDLVFEEAGGARILLKRLVVCQGEDIVHLKSVNNKQRKEWTDVYTFTRREQLHLGWGRKIMGMTNRKVEVNLE